MKIRQAHISILIAVAVVWIIGVSSPSWADTVPLKMNFQGHLKDSQGFLRTGSFDVTFNLYDTEISGVPIWTEIHYSVPVMGGLFRATLGETYPLIPSLFDGSARWVGISISGDTGEMVPRVPLVSVAHAIHAYEAHQATYSIFSDSATNANNSQLLDSHPGNYYLNSDNFTGDTWQRLVDGAGLAGTRLSLVATTLVGIDYVNPSFPYIVMRVTPINHASDTRPLSGKKMFIEVDGLQTLWNQNGAMINVKALQVSGFVTISNEFTPPVSLPDVSAPASTFTFEIKAPDEDPSIFIVRFIPPLISNISTGNPGQIRVNIYSAE